MCVALLVRVNAGIMVSNAADEIILEPNLIARHYLRSWFLLDLISSLPLDYLLLLMSPETSVRQLMHAGRPFSCYTSTFAAVTVCVCVCVCV